MPTNLGGVCLEVERAVNDPNKVGYWLNYSNFFLSKPPLASPCGSPCSGGSGYGDRLVRSLWIWKCMTSVLDRPWCIGPIFTKTTRALVRICEARCHLSGQVAMSPEHRSQAQQWHGRQKVKYRHMTKWWLAPTYFAYSYIYKLGFLDGRRGLVFCLLKFHYFFQIRLRILEKLAA